MKNINPPLTLWLSVLIGTILSSSALAADVKWYVHKKGQPGNLGPFTEAELKAQIEDGSVSPNDLTWSARQKQWLPASQAQLSAVEAPEGPPAPSQKNRRTRREETQRGESALKGDLKNGFKASLLGGVSLWPTTTDTADFSYNVGGVSYFTYGAALGYRLNFIEPELRFRNVSSSFDITTGEDTLPFGWSFPIIEAGAKIHLSFLHLGARVGMGLLSSSATLGTSSLSFSTYPIVISPFVGCEFRFGSHLGVGAEVAYILTQASTGTATTTIGDADPIKSIATTDGFNVISPMITLSYHF